MARFMALSAALLMLASPVVAEGDIEKGEKAFKKCKSCHMIVSPEGDVIFKGGRTGPNLWGVLGRQAGTVEGYKYGSSIVEAGDAGLIWDADTIVAYIADPKKFLSETLGKSARSKMTYKLKSGGEDVAAYLASVSPAPEAQEDAAAEDTPATE